MARKTAVLGFSVSPELARQYEELAARERTTKSDLFCVFRRSRTPGPKEGERSFRAMANASRSVATGFS
jgi:hypothetical protein